MKYDMVISNGTVITPEEISQVDIGVQGGIIKEIAEGLQGQKMIDARDCYVLPGAVDPHVHLNMPTATTTSSDNWETGTKAAACGGVTTVIDFVEPEGEQLLLDALESRRTEAEQGSVLDFGLHMTITNAEQVTLDQIKDVIGAGVTSFKLYTTYQGFLLDDAQLLRVMSEVSENGALVLVHCESDAIVQYATASVVKSGLNDPSAHPLSRPPQAEAEAVNRVLTLAGTVGVPAYIVHISTAAGAAALARALDNGQTAWGETCPQYLVLSEELYRLQGFEGAKFVCSPPLRAQENQSALWQQLSAGSLHSIGTDHCPFFFQDQKKLGLDDFRLIPGGLPGIQSRLELVYTCGVAAGYISLQQWVETCCSNPARIFGLDLNKGTIQIGADADLVVFDPRIQETIRHENLSERVDYTPYEGIVLEGKVRSTFAGGKMIADRGKYIGKDRKGMFLPRLPIKESS